MEYQDGQTEPKCFASGSLTQTWRIQNVTMQNSWNGVYDNTGVVVDNCKIVSCPGPGIITGSPNGLEIVNGVFEDNGLGIFAVSPCSGVRIVDSEFTSSSISLQNTTDVTIVGCTMVGSTGGAKFDHSTGSVVDCVISGTSSYGVTAFSHSTVLIERSSIQSAGPAIARRISVHS